MPKSTSQKQAIEILADPSSAEHQWINACTILENENFKPVKDVKAGALGWIGAVIDSTITAISSGMYLTLMYAVGCGLGMDISLSWTGSMPFVVTMPFIFGFAHGLWMESYKAGRIWAVSFGATSVCIAIATLCLRHCYYTYGTWGWMKTPFGLDLDIVFALTTTAFALFVGRYFFRSLKTITNPWKVVTFAQIVPFVLGFLCLPLQSATNSNVIAAAVLWVAAYLIGFLTYGSAKPTNRSSAVALAITAVSPMILAGFYTIVVSIFYLLFQNVPLDIVTRAVLPYLAACFVILVLSIAGSLTGRVLDGRDRSLPSLCD